MGHPMFYLQPTPLGSDSRGAAYFSTVRTFEVCILEVQISLTPLNNNIYLIGPETEVALHSGDVDKKWNIKMQHFPFVVSHSTRMCKWVLASSFNPCNGIQGSTLTFDITCHYGKYA